MAEVIAILIIVYALKSAIKDGREHWGKSRAANRSESAGKSKPRRAASAVQHDIGYWASQVAHGFPPARHGLASGWHAERRAQAEGKAAWQKAKAEHLETRVRLIPEIQAARQRQQAALTEIRKTQEPEPAPNDTSGTCRICGAPEGKECLPDCPYGRGDWRTVAKIDRMLKLRKSGYDGPVDQDGNPIRPTYSFGRADLPNAWPTDDPEEAHSRARSASTSGKPWAVTEYPPGGGPGKTVARYRNGREEPEEGSANEREGSPDDASPADETAPSPTEGTEPMATQAADTTYTEQLDALTRIRDESEEELARIRTRRILNGLDSLTGLGLDPETLGKAAEVDDALREEEEAAQRALEAATAARDGLIRRHGAHQEATDNVGAGAEPGFYAR